MGLNTIYKAQTFDLSDLTGISNETLAMHFKLYEGYVTNTNTLNEADRRADRRRRTRCDQSRRLYAS